VYSDAYFVWNDLVASSRLLNAVPLALALSANALSAADNSILGLLAVVAVEPELPLPQELERGAAEAELEPHDEPLDFGVTVGVEREEPQDEPLDFGVVEIVGVEREVEPHEEPLDFGAEYDEDLVEPELPHELAREPPPLNEEPPLREPPPKLLPLALAAKIGVAAVAKIRAIVRRSFFICNPQSAD